MATTVTLPLDMLILDEDIQPREMLSNDLIREYATLYREAHPLPPLKVFQEGEQYWVADGFHRKTAAQQAGRSEIDVDLQSGTRRDAILYACGANKHGKARTSADKRRALARLLMDSEWGHWSNVEIAWHCGVAHSFVAKVRRSLDSEESDKSPRTYRTKHGTTSTMDVSHIGRGAQRGMTGAPTHDPGPLVLEDQMTPNGVATVSPSEITLVAKEVPDKLAHDTAHLDVETTPNLTDGLLPSTTAPAAAAVGSALGGNQPGAEAVGADVLTIVLRLIDELSAALRRLDTEAPVTALQRWGPERIERCIHSSSALMKHLHTLQGTVYPYYLDMMQARDAEEWDAHMTESNERTPLGGRHHREPSVVEGALGLTKEVTLTRPTAKACRTIQGKSAPDGLMPVEGSEASQRLGDRPQNARRWARTLQVEGFSVEEIAAKLKAMEGGRRWNRGTVLETLRAKGL